MSWNELDWKSVISIYAAIVSTFVALWRVYEYRDDKKGNFEIRMITGTQSPITDYWDEEDKDVNIVALITNVGKKNRYIKTPYFNVSPKKVIREHTEMMLSEATKKGVPTKLEPGEEFRFEIPMWLLVKYKKAGAKEMRVEICDTHKKLYKSEWKKL